VLGIVNYNWAILGSQKNMLFNISCLARIVNDIQRINLNLRGEKTFEVWLVFRRTMRGFWHLGYRVNPSIQFNNYIFFLDFDTQSDQNLDLEFGRCLLKDRTERLVAKNSSILCDSQAKWCVHITRYFPKTWKGQGEIESKHRINTLSFGGSTKIYFFPCK